MAFSKPWDVVIIAYIWLNRVDKLAHRNLRRSQVTSTRYMLEICIPRQQTLSEMFLSSMCIPAINSGVFFDVLN